MGNWWLGEESEVPSFLSKVESYDPDSDSWQTEASLIIERSWPVAWIANGRIYVGGGKNSSGSRLNSIEIYDPITKQWSSAGNFPEKIHSADAVVINNTVHVIAGHNGSSYSNKVFAADLNASVEGVHDLYVKTGDASTGRPVQAEVADDRLGQASCPQVSNALKPVVVGQPSSVVGVDEQSVVLAVDVDRVTFLISGKRMEDIVGATGRTLAITDLNASQDEGDYTVLVSNVFGSATSSVAQIDVNGSLTEGLLVGGSLMKQKVILPTIPVGMETMGT